MCKRNLRGCCTAPYMIGAIASSVDSGGNCNLSGSVLDLMRMRRRSLGAHLAGRSERHYHRSSASFSLDVLLDDFPQAHSLDLPFDIFDKAIK